MNEPINCPQCDKRNTSDKNMCIQCGYSLIKAKKQQAIRRAFPGLIFISVTFVPLFVILVFVTGGVFFPELFKGYGIVLLDKRGPIELEVYSRKGGVLTVNVNLYRQNNKNNQQWVGTGQTKCELTPKEVRKVVIPIVSKESNLKIGDIVYNNDTVSYNVIETSINDSSITWREPGGNVPLIRFLGEPRNFFIGLFMVAIGIFAFVFVRKRLHPTPPVMNEKQSTQEFNTVLTKNLDEAIGILFNQAIHELPILAPEQVHSAYQKIQRRWNAQALINGSLVQIKDAMLTAVQGFCQQNKFKHFQIAVFNEKIDLEYHQAECAQFMIFTMFDFKPIRIWKTQEELFMCGMSDFQFISAPSVT